MDPFGSPYEMGKLGQVAGDTNQDVLVYGTLWLQNQQNRVSIQQLRATGQSCFWELEVPSGEYV